MNSYQVYNPRSSNRIDLNRIFNPRILIQDNPDHVFSMTKYIASKSAWIRTKLSIRFNPGVSSLINPNQVFDPIQTKTFGPNDTKRVFNFTQSKTFNPNKTKRGLQSNSIGGFQSKQIRMKFLIQINRKLRSI